jgi:hypothetical protein
LPDNAFTACPKPTRLSAGARPRKASRTSCNPCSRPASAGASAPAWRPASSRTPRARLRFERLDGTARHRLGQRAADIGQILAQGLDRIVDAALHRRAGRPPQGARWRRREFAVERALPRRDLRDHLVHAIGFAARIGGGLGGGFATHIGAAQAFLAQAGERTVDAVDPLLECARGGAALGNDLVEPAIEVQDRLGDPLRRVVSRACRAEVIFRQQRELAPEVIQPVVDRGQVITVIALRIGLVGVERDAVIRGLLEDDRVEPLADRDA